MGLGSHSYMEGERFHNIYDLQEYIKADGDGSLLKEEIEVITVEDALAEFMFLGLRLTEGVSFRRFRERFGQEMKNIYGSQIEELVRDDLLEEDKTGIRLTRRGVDISNFVFEKFLF